MEQQHAAPAKAEDEDALDAPVVIDLGDAATLTKGGSGSSTEDKRYQYG